MSEQINEQVLDFQEPVKTITATEALKSKSNFEQFIYENQTEIYALFKDSQQPLRIISSQLTQSIEGFVNIFQKVKSLSELDKNLTPSMLWVVANEKQEWLDLINTLNYLLKKNCCLYVIKASLEEDNIEYTILTETKINRNRLVMTNTKQLQKEYWQRYAEICDAEGNPDFQVEAHPRHFQYIPVGKTGIQIVQTIHTPLKMVASELFITNDIDKKIFDKIYTHKEDIEAEFGNLSWQRNEGKKSARIRFFVDIDIMDKNNWDAAIKEQLKIAEKIAEVMCKYI